MRNNIGIIYIYIYIYKLIVKGNQGTCPCCCELASCGELLCSGGFLLVVFLQNGKIPQNAHKSF